ncbi:fibronectin type III-like domain-contianing protein [Sphingomonas aerolata]
MLQRQLVGFRRIPLRAGEVRTVDFAIDPRSLGMVEHDGTHAVVPGRYRLFVGGGQPGDAAGIWTDVTITGTRTVLPK